MQIDVSVKKPTGRSSNAAISESHQVGRDLREATLDRSDIERDRGDLIDHRNSVSLEPRVNAHDVALAALARVDAEMRELLRIREHDELRPLGLAARDAGHARVDPLVRAARAHQAPLTGDQRLTAVDEHADLRRSSAHRTNS